MAETPESGPPRRERRDRRLFRPGDMPPLFGDTAATLIVDDNEQLAEVVRRLLTREGYDCTVAASAADARARLAERVFAIALVDVMMPGESGLELVADMLAHHPDLAVVMVTAIDDPRIAELAMQSGAYGYVVKPFSPNQMLITVANAGQRRCLEIERDAYERRLELTVHEQAIDLDDTIHQLQEARNHVVGSPET
jgi:DNA-binding NtrC family response regulator